MTIAVSTLTGYPFGCLATPPRTAIRSSRDRRRSLLRTEDDMALPVEVRELPADLAALDRLLADPGLLAPVERAWEAAARGRGRPTIPIERLVRLMVIKQRSGWDYGTLVREVSDSLHLRRFCRIALTERVPDESTIRKLVRRLGPEVVEEITRAVIAKAAAGERRFVARAARCDSTVVEADIRHPTDIALASRAAARRVRAANRTLTARTGNAKQRVLEMTGQVGELAARSARETRRLAARLRARARGRGAAQKRAAASRLDGLAGRAEKIARQITSGWPARRSATGSSRSPIPTPARSARASSASRRSSATCFSSSS
jgi:IS5 family transposase